VARRDEKASNAASISLEQSGWRARKAIPGLLEELPFATVAGKHLKELAPNELLKKASLVIHASELVGRKNRSLLSNAILNYGFPHSKRSFTHFASAALSAAR